jgi:hypothetical protein
LAFKTSKRQLTDQAAPKPDHPQSANYCQNRTVLDLPKVANSSLEKLVLAKLKQDCSFRALSNATKLPNSLLASWLAFVSCNKPPIAIVRRIWNAPDMMDWQSYPQFSSCLHFANLGSKLVAKKK